MGILHTSDGSEDIIDRRPHETAVLRFLQKESKTVEEVRYVCHQHIDPFDTMEAYRVDYGKRAIKAAQRGSPQPTPHPPEQRSEIGRAELVARTLSHMESNRFIVSEKATDDRGRIRRVRYNLTLRGRDRLEHPEKFRRIIGRPLHAGNTQRWEGEFPEIEMTPCFFCDEPVIPGAPGTAMLVTGWLVIREKGGAYLREPGPVNRVLHRHELGKYAHGTCLRGE